MEVTVNVQYLWLQYMWEVTRTCMWPRSCVPAKCFMYGTLPLSAQGNTLLAQVHTEIRSPCSYLHYDIRRVHWPSHTVPTIYMNLMKCPSQTSLNYVLKTGTHASQTHLWQISICRLLRCAFINQKQIEFNESVLKTRGGQYNAVFVETRNGMESPESESLWGGGGFPCRPGRPRGPLRLL